MEIIFISLRDLDLNIALPGQGNEMKGLDSVPKICICIAIPSNEFQQHFHCYIDTKYISPGIPMLWHFLFRCFQVRLLPHLATRKCRRILVFLKINPLGFFKMILNLVCPQGDCLSVQILGEKTGIMHTTGTETQYDQEDYLSLKVQENLKPLLLVIVFIFSVYFGYIMKKHMVLTFCFTLYQTIKLLNLTPYFILFLSHTNFPGRFSLV